MEGLEYETNLRVPDPGQLFLVHRGHGLAIEPVSAARRRIEAADDVHERRLTGAGRAHNGEVVAPLHREVDAAERVDVIAPHTVPAIEIFKPDDGVVAGDG